MPQQQTKALLRCPLRPRWRPRCKDKRAAVRGAVAVGKCAERVVDARSGDAAGPGWSWQGAVGLLESDAVLPLLLISDAVLLSLVVDGRAGGAGGHLPMTNNFEYVACVKQLSVRGHENSGGLQKQQSAGTELFSLLFDLAALREVSVPELCQRLRFCESRSHQDRLAWHH